MAITSEIIGKLGGGAEIETTDVSMAGFNSRFELTQVTVPPGEQMLVAVVGTFTSSGSGSYAPLIEIGGVAVSGGVAAGQSGSASAIITKSSSVVVYARGVATTEFHGTVYTVKL